MRKLFIEADSIAYETMSGIGHATLEIIRELDRVDFKDLKVTLLVPHGTAERVRAFGFTNVKIRQLPGSQKYINYILTRTSIPLPITWLYGNGVYLFPNYKTWNTGLFSKSVTFVHDVAFKIYPETIQPKNLVYLEKNFTRWLRRTHTIISISRSSAQDFKEYFPEYADKVLVDPLGVDPSVFYRRPVAEVQAMLKKYTLPKEYFLYVGNIEPRKNIAELLESYRVYADKAKQPKALVIVGGGGWKNEAILAQIDTYQSEGYAIHRPSKYVVDEDLPALYSGATALTHIAIHEGFGLSPVQAQACGAFVVAADIPVLREIIDAKQAAFVPLGDVSGTAAALQAATQVKSGQQLYHYTWEQTVLGIKEIVDKI